MTLPTTPGLGGCGRKASRTSGNMSEQKFADNVDEIDASLSDDSDSGSVGDPDNLDPVGLDNIITYSHPYNLDNSENPDDLGDLDGQSSMDEITEMVYSVTDENENLKRLLEECENSESRSLALNNYLTHLLARYRKSNTNSETKINLLLKKLRKARDTFNDPVKEGHREFSSRDEFYDNLQS